MMMMSLNQGLAVRFAHEGVSPGGRVRRRQLGLMQLGRPWLQLGLMQLGLMQLGLMHLGGLMQLGRPWRKWARNPRRPARLAPAGGGSNPEALPCALTVSCGF